jgi:sterol desaturase/sphingolipid hydroxylase (fatty acid hydroxylase superfamily)
LFYIGISKILQHQKFRLEEQAILKKDIVLSGITIICNALIFILGVFLWRNGWINILTDASFLKIALMTILMLVCMDFLMYVTHRIAHSKVLYKLVHRKHHEHDSTNALSLFVLHPYESLGFGFLMLAVIAIIDFPPESVAIYLTLNLIWGTIGHLNVEPISGNIYNRYLSKALGMAKFHNLHHQNIESNYGFYTLYWDKLFKTLNSKMNNF